MQVKSEINCTMHCAIPNIITIRYRFYAIFKFERAKYSSICLVLAYLISEHALVEGSRLLNIMQDNLLIVTRKAKANFITKPTLDFWQFRCLQYFNSAFCLTLPPLNQQFLT